MSTIKESLQHLPLCITQHILPRASIALQTPSEHIERVGPSIFKVRSEDCSSYLVCLQNSALSCDCPEWKVTNLPCQHIMAVFIKSPGYDWHTLPWELWCSSLLQSQQQLVKTEADEPVVTGKAYETVKIQSSLQTQIVCMSQLLNPTQTNGDNDTDTVTFRSAEVFRDTLSSMANTLFTACTDDNSIMLRSQEKVPGKETRVENRITESCDDIKSMQSDMLAGLDRLRQCVSFCTNKSSLSKAISELAVLYQWFEANLTDFQDLVTIPDNHMQDDSTSTLENCGSIDKPIAERASRRKRGRPPTYANFDVTNHEDSDWDGDNTMDDTAVQASQRRVGRPRKNNPVTVKTEKNSKKKLERGRPRQPWQTLTPVMNSYHCPWCVKTFPKRSRLLVHQRMHTGEKPYTCSSCQMSFAYKNSWMLHMRRLNHGTPEELLPNNTNQNITDDSIKKFKHQCKYCHQNYRKMCQLKYHMTKHTGEKPHKCEDCGKAYGHKTTLLTHRREVHFTENINKCEVCQETFRLARTLTKHMLIHHSEGHQCAQCGKTFRAASLLQRHMATHTGETAFKCPVCQRGFRDKHRLHTHFRVHTGEKPFMCSVCGRAFGQRSVLTNHMKTHSGEKAFQCQHCAKMFSRKNTLTHHVRTHTGEKPHKCQQCGAAFARADKLIRHLRIHTGETPYHCTMCVQKFKRSEQLNKHMIKAHNVMHKTHIQDVAARSALPQNGITSGDGLILHKELSGLTADELGKLAYVPSDKSVEFSVEAASLIASLHAAQPAQNTSTPTSTCSPTNTALTETPILTNPLTLKTEEYCPVPPQNITFFPIALQQHTLINLDPPTN